MLMMLVQQNGDAAGEPMMPTIMEVESTIATTFSLPNMHQSSGPETYISACAYMHV